MKAAKCSLCGEPIYDGPSMSIIAGGLVCHDCGECCRDAEIQARHYGKRAGISGTLTTEDHKKLRK